jgi:hypothetical protein
MAFGWAGGAAGGAQGLEEIVAQRMLAQKLEAEIANRQKQTELEQAALNQRSVEHSDNMRSRQRDDDRMDADRRDRNNSQGVRKMVGESLMQGGDPDRRALAAMQIEAGDAPTMLNEPNPERDPIADHRAKAEIDAQFRPRPSGGGQAPNYLTLIDGNGNQKRVPDGQQANDLLGQGWRLFDAVAARSSKPENDKEAVDTANEAKRLASALVNHKGFGGVFGLAGSYIPTINQDTADGEQLLGSLQSMLTMENMGKMKGVLSDSDMKVLRQASTTLSNRMGDAAARAELNRVIEVMGRVGGEGPTAGMPSMDLATSRGPARAPAAAPSNDARVAELIKKYGG